MPPLSKLTLLTKPALNPSAPYWQTNDGEFCKLYLGHVIDRLKEMPAKSVQCVVTSPPYWGLRDYGMVEKFKTEEQALQWASQTAARLNRDFGGSTVRHNTKGTTYDAQNKLWLGRVGTETLLCGKVWGQIGSEPSPDCGTHGKAQCGKCFVCSMVEVCAEIYRVLRDDGVFWLNLGDSYSGGKTGRADLSNLKGSFGNRDLTQVKSGDKYHGTQSSQRKPEGIPSGNLIGIPWRVALALQEWGWVLRQDVIWSKPSPMPESVRNRCTKSHEYIFLLTKSMNYFYDADAIREPLKLGADHDRTRGDHRIQTPGDDYTTGSKGSAGLRGQMTSNPDGRNKRSVWRVSSQGYPGAHYAVFPPKLIEPCILSGTSPKCCGNCSAPWRRVTVEKKLKRDRPNDYVKRTGEEGTGNSCANSVAGVEVKTLRFEPTCECLGKQVKTRVETVDEETGKVKKRIVYNYFSDLPLDQHPVKPCVVLDPFVGSGTSCVVAIDHGRHSIGIDLSEEYLKKNAIPRIEGELLSRPALAHLVGEPVKSLVVGYSDNERS